MYCHDCWLFADTKNDWVDGFEPNTRHLLRKIKRHERNAEHIGASATLYRWNVNTIIDAENEKIVKEKINFWREVLRRIINIILTMAILSLAFRCDEETVGNGICEGGNFLGLVMMQTQFDTFLQEISVRYLSASIQNEIIKLIAKATRNSLVQTFTVLFNPRWHHQ